MIYIYIFCVVNQALATLAFFGVAVNLVLFLTRVLDQESAIAANGVSKWTGTVYLCSLVGAFISDSYWGRYATCAVFQVIFVFVSIFNSFLLTFHLLYESLSHKLSVERYVLKPKRVGFGAIISDIRDVPLKAHGVR